MASHFRNGLFIAVVGAGMAGMAGNAHATTVLVSADEVHRVNGTYPNLYTPNGVFFSTLSPDPDRQLLKTNTSTFLTALQAALGPSPSYVINSAELVVGSAGDNYAVTIPAYQMIRTWDPTDVTWNDPDPDDSLTPFGWANLGVGIGDYSPVQATSATVNDGSVTEFQGLAATVQSWLTIPTGNHGLFFPSSGASGADYTGAENVFWRIDAVVPEPASLSLLAMSGTALLLRRRKR